MGSRSKFHKSDRATSPGRQLLHVGARLAKGEKFVDPRRRPPTRVTFTGAFWELTRELRQAAAKGEKRPDNNPNAKPPETRTPRRQRRAEAFASARAQFPRVQRAEALEAARRAAVLS